MALVKFCPECLEDTKCTLVKVVEKFEIKGEPVEVELMRFKCSNCLNIIPAGLGEEEKAYRAAYTEYRKRKNLLQPSEIVDLRKKYGLSQRQLAKILGWSHVTLSRYESGALQSAGHNNQLAMLQNPANMLMLLEKRAHELPDKEVVALRDRVKKMLEKTERDEEDSSPFQFESLFIKRPSIFTGFRVFNLDKLIQTVKFFGANDSWLFKVKLVKCLWYADFLHFKRSTLSINGLQYVHLPLGPVPDKYDLLLGLVEATGHVKKEYVDIGYDNLGELYKPVGGFDSSLFTPEELQTLQDVCDAFKNESSKSISERSHREAAWQETVDGDLISYEYARYLTLN